MVVKNKKTSGPLLSFVFKNKNTFVKLNINIVLKVIVFKNIKNFEKCVRLYLQSHLRAKQSVLEVQFYPNKNRDDQDQHGKKSEIIRRKLINIL